MDERVVVSNSHWVAVVPFWAVWTFEVLCCPSNQSAVSLIWTREGASSSQPLPKSC